MLTESPLRRSSDKLLPLGRQRCWSGTSPKEDRTSEPISDTRSQKVFLFGPFRLSTAERLLSRGDDALPIGSRAFDLLTILVERAGEIVSHKELVARAWPNHTFEEENLRVNIAALRKLLGHGLNGARYISSVVNRGYCFVAPVSEYAPQRANAPSVNSLIPNLPAPSMSLPAPSTRMVGRDHTVRQLLTKLIACRFISIVGSGGVGKTTVAVAVAHALMEGFQGAVFFVDLGAVADPWLVPTAVLSALGTAPQAGDPMLDLLRFLGDRKILLVLDNCEHVVETVASLVERVMNEARQTHLLVTTRESLRVEGEHVHLLHSLETPPDHPGLPAAEVLRYSAVRFFMERALAAGYHEELSDAEAHIVASICRRLDGIALAIELVASRVTSHGISGTAELLDDRFKVIWQGRRTALPRHQTLNSMLDWSYNLLSDSDRKILCRLSIFVGDFTIKAAREVAADVEVDDAVVTHALTRLIEKSLISTRFKRCTYFRLLNTTKAYALIKLASYGEIDRVAKRHATAFLSHLQENQFLQSGSNADDLNEWALHIGNVRAALDWGLSDHGDRGIGLELAACAAPILIRLSLFDECRRYCERALAFVDEASRGTRAEMTLLDALAHSSMFTSGNSATRV
jgi:predicted ATPase/DNA-binding winged helix-turn-helix (wHTH) protein